MSPRTSKVDLERLRTLSGANYWWPLPESKVLVVKTVWVVWPGPVGPRVDPPLPLWATLLGAHLVRSEVELRLVRARLHLDWSCWGPVVAAPGVEDEGTHLVDLFEDWGYRDRLTSLSVRWKLVLRARRAQSIRLLRSSCDGMKTGELEFSALLLKVKCHEMVTQYSDHLNNDSKSFSNCSLVGEFMRMSGDPILGLIIIE